MVITFANGSELGAQARGWIPGPRALRATVGCTDPGHIYGQSPLTAGTTDARLKLRAISAKGDLGLPPGSLKNKGVIVVFRSFLHARNPDMISGGGLGPPSPLSPARTYLWAQLGSRKGEKRPPRPLFLPQKPLLGAAGDVATDSGASISLLPRGCGCPPASGGDQKSGGQREFGGSLWHVQPSLCPGPRARPSLHDPHLVLQSWWNVGLHYTPSPCRGWGTRSRRSGHPVGRVRRQRLWEGRHGLRRSSSPREGSTLQQRGARGPAQPLWGLFPILQSPEF